MQKILSFSELDELATDHLQAMLETRRLTEENKRLIAYELRIRSLDVKEEQLKYRKL